MQPALPIRWDPTTGTRYGLIKRMVTRSGELRPLDVAIQAEVPKPILTWLEALHYIVLGISGVVAGMLAWG